MGESVGRGPGFLHVPHRTASDPQRLQSNWDEVERVVNGIVSGPGIVATDSDNDVFAPGDDTVALSVTVPASVFGLTIAVMTVTVSGTDLADNVNAWYTASSTTYGFPTIDGGGSDGVPLIVTGGSVVNVSVQAPGATMGTATINLAWTS